ncbi:MAG: GNAT family N-acetyltransferase [Acidimicrobiaceae bacterium]|nr:GNAT family N-acetyltransferase [Acidimicrobiaceae bacterium]
MEARLARTDDAGEVVRLAAMLFSSMGMDASGSDWQEAGRRHVGERLDNDMAAFVVDHPGQSGLLVAAAAGTIARRLPTPLNPSGSAGYVQWVCTEPEFRGRGLGRLVMSSLLAWFDARDVRTVELHATPMAEAMYLELGFDDEGPRALRRRR